MTEKEKKAYMENPDKCPFCGGDLSVTEDYLALNAKEGLRITECQSCFRTFSETHLLVRVEAND